jgi:hypothetical protein
MRWAGHVERRYGGEERLYGVLVGKPEEKRTLWRTSCRWEDNIKMDLKWDVGAWTGSSWLRVGTVGEHL